MPPWKFVGFEVPAIVESEKLPPATVGAMPVDLSVDDYATESMVESQEYGSSLIETAYQPWLDLRDTICSLKMSRQNAARLERIIGIHTGKLDPEKAAHYVNMVSNQIAATSKDLGMASWEQGNVQTVINHLVPIFGDRGGLDINAVQGTPDIQGLEDVNFHIKRLGSALGIDPSLLGFGDFLSGGLGDGGFFRVSIMAAMKANCLRMAIANGLHRLAEIHIAYKYNKVFLLNERPWKITFNAVNSAIEREEQENLESRAGIAGSLVGIVATLDQEFAIADKRALMKKIWDMLKLDADSFEQSFPENKTQDTTDDSDIQEEGDENAQ